ncbi:hypothetical protein K488DRAFT_84430 [Vararia minispora EC-137]|uniref:Uncharacterized protein n=1 Tax=Vararia minispora EC-137 TaxID=1314806 RepID=A0ACB8QQD1_9AGAM|nr:hypothetical protein K488DRAFT_84430 [Vararia minispora EC-137]
MAGFIIDYEHDSEEVITLKKHILNQDNKCSRFEDLLYKSHESHEDTKRSLTETIQKLRAEADNAVDLSSKLEACLEELNSERVRRQNFETSIQNSNAQLKAGDSARRELQATLETVSAREQNTTRALAEMQREKAALELRLRDLETNLQQVVSATTPSRSGRGGRPRASSLSSIHISSLERDLAEARTMVNQLQVQLQHAGEQAAAARAAAVRAENEVMALERRLKAQVQALQDQLEERDDELAYLHSQQGGGSLVREREEELMQRIEEEERKVATLQKLVQDTRRMEQLQESLTKTEKRLKEEIAKVKGVEDRNTTLLEGHEKTKRELDGAQSRLERLEDTLRSRDAQMALISQRERDLHLQLNKLEAENVSLRERRELGSPPPDEAERAGMVEGLLSSITRLRADRDGLRRDLQFSQAEAKFTVQSLEKKVAELSTAPSAQSTISRLSRLSHASLIAISHISSSHDDTLRELQWLRDRFGSEQQHADDEVAELESSLSAVRTELESRSSELAESTNQRVELNTIVDQLKSQINDLTDTSLRSRADATRMQSAFEQNEAQISELLRSLQAVEAERDSLSSQVLAVQHELAQAQAQVIESEARYVDLQAKQLSSLPSDGLVRAFQEQIQEYKDRVKRRNEQIGEHQHDIKRLEANQRLQEERLTELNNDLDIAMSEKEAMIEDCAEAREARDMAVRRAEELEDRLEGLEYATQTLEAQHLDQTSSLISVWASAVSKTRLLAGRFNAVLHDTSARHCTTLRQLQDAEEQRSLTASVSDERAAQLASMRKELESISGDFEQATVAFSLSQSNLNRVEQLLTSERGERTALEAQIQVLENQLSARVSDISKLQSQLDGMHEEAELHNLTSQTTHDAKVGELEGEIQRVTQAISELKIAEASLRDQLEASELKHHEAAEREANASRRLVEEMETMRKDHATELESALVRLEAVTKELEDAQSTYTTKLVHLRATIDELSTAKTSLEEEVRLTFAQLKDSGKTVDDLVKLRATHAQELGTLRGELAQSHQELKDSHATQESMSVSHLQELEELSVAKSALEARVAELEASIEVLESSIEGAKVAHAAELATAARFEADAQAHRDELARVRSQHEEELQLMCKTQERSACRLEEMQARLNELQDSLEAAQASVQEAEVNLASGSKDRAALETRNLSLQTDVHNLLLSKESMEKEMSDCERRLEQSRAEVKKAQEQLAHQAGQTSTVRVQLDLQAAQHRKDVEDLRKQIAVLESRSSQDDTIRELQEQLKEMDVLMSQKNEEIEGNDDIRIALMKEKKKLVAKVDSLTRRVQSLQTKLAAAKEAAAATPTAAPSPHAAPLAPAHPSVASGSRPAPVTAHPWHNSTPPVPLAPPAEIPPVPALPAGTPPSPSRRRMASGPPSMSRGKTPEPHLPAVFRRAQTPEAPRPAPALELRDRMPTTSMLGQKRAAPDDLEDHRVAQGFTSEGTLDQERGVGQSTPRARKSLRSGFTPVRNTTARPMTTIGSTSPVRGGGRTGGPLIADVTNSPRGSTAHVRASSEAAPVTKRGGWTNKLKSNNPANRTVSSMRSLFERGS